MTDTNRKEKTWIPEDAFSSTWRANMNRTISHRMPSVSFDHAKKGKTSRDSQRSPLPYVCFSPCAAPAGFATNGHAPAESSSCSAHSSTEGMYKNGNQKFLTGF